MNNTIIKTENLVKNYRRYKKQEGLRGSIASLFRRTYEEKAAVNHISLSIQPGEFVGLIGPNGAGKTTLIKMLTGIIAPTEGTINVMGYYPNDLKNAFKKQYAVVMGQKSQLFFELTVNDTLRLFKEIYELPEAHFQANKAYLVKLFEVEDLMDVQVRTLSLGERMKMELIVALLHNPRVLFLDEPTIGLDAIASRQIRSFLKEINEERGTTILLTSHYIEDIRTLCKRTIVINHGTKLYDGATDELFDRYQRNKRIIVTYDKPVDHTLKGTGAVDIIMNEPYKKVYETPKENVKQLFLALMEHEPKDIVVEEEELGVVVERIYHEESVIQEERDAHEEGIVHKEGSVHGETAGTGRHYPDGMES